YVGEISMLAPDGLRTASACTKEYTRLLVMTRSDFEGLLARRPTLATEFTRVLISRLNESHTNAIRDLQEKNVRLSRAYEDLKNAQDQLIKQERMERELQVAYEIQMSILPEAMPDFAGFDFGALIVPAREVGGDFFDLLPLQDGKMGIVIGDITDKGVPAAIFMAQTHALLRASASHTKSPGQTLLEINQLLLGMNTRNMFATILYGILDGQTRQFSYARAGHELPIVLKPSGEIEIGEHGVGMPVGIFEEPKIDEQTLILPPGSILLLYTDGATDALVTDERRFGMEGLLEAFRKAANLPAQEVCKTIFNSLVVEGRPELRIDDVTLVVICSLD
ncbi:MAG TPA: SpoIIE family protein phosphatase, partial [Anaerolineales bacterium]|nr:SpoIIE family protein phosphatase [Anaerolineales bacterium]